MYNTELLTILNCSLQIVLKNSRQPRLAFVFFENNGYAYYNKMCYFVMVIFYSWWSMQNGGKVYFEPRVVREDEKRQNNDRSNKMLINQTDER